MSKIQEKRFKTSLPPDLKALSTRLEALVREMKMRFDHVDARFEQADKMNLERFTAAEKIAAARHETYLANHATVMSALDRDRWLAKLENERIKPEAQHA